jgi:hypothetical protein
MKKLQLQSRSENLLVFAVLLVDVLTGSVACGLVSVWSSVVTVAPVTVFGALLFMVTVGMGVALCSTVSVSPLVNIFEIGSDSLAAIISLGGYPPRTT